MRSKHIIVRASEIGITDANTDFNDFRNKRRIWDSYLGESTVGNLSKGFNFEIGASSANNLSAAISSISVEEIDEKEVVELRNDPGVSDVFPSMPLTLIDAVASKENPNLDGATYTWGVEAVNAHNSIFTGRGVKVAVLDTGIDAAHVAFAGINITSKNYTKEKDGDINGHGTHCAGTIFGRDVNGIRIGIARGVEDVFIGKVLGKGGGDVSLLIQAINDAVNFGADVISMSLGIDFPGYVEARIEQLPHLKSSVIVSEALNVYRKNVSLIEKHIVALRAYASPVLVIAAAGNESARPDYRISVCAPAISEGFISVGAVGRNLSNFSVANFSNSEPMLSGPGIDIVSAKRGGGLVSLDGTSMATPHVAGIAALWAENLKKQGLFNYNVFNARLIASCSTVGLANELPIDYGAGIIQAPI